MNRREGPTRWIALLLPLALLVVGFAFPSAAASGPKGRIVFSRSNDNGLNDDWEIFTMNVDGTRLTQLTDNGWNDITPTWSPTGTIIAFARETNVGEHNAVIMLMSARGSGPIRLTDPQHDSFAPAWSPDGTRIAYAYCCGTDGFYEIHVMNADGSGDMRLIGDGADPSWSPDGTRLVYDGVGSVVGIQTMNADGTDRTPLTASADYEPVWSPDGTRIAFQRPPLGIFTINADGTGETQVTTGQDFGPAWSPDGLRIVFARFTAHVTDSDLFSVGIDGTRLVRLTSTPTFEVSPDWT